MLNRKISFFLANVYFFTLSFVYSLLCLPFGYIFLLLHKIFPQAISAHTIRKISYTYGKFFWFVNKIILPVHCRDKDKARREAPCVIVANHQSVFDLILFGAQSLNNFVYFVKSWPFKAFFFFAPLMRAGEYINIDSQSYEENEAQCLKLLAEGTSIIIFPEGRRTKDGKLGKFHSGAYQLAIKANVPLVSFVYVNTYERLPSSAHFISAGRIEIDTLPTLYPKDFAKYPFPHREMMRYSYQQFSTYFKEKGAPYV